MYGFSPSKKDLEDDIRQLRTDLIETQARLDGVTKLMSRERQERIRDVARVEAIAKKK